MKGQEQKLLDEPLKQGKDIAEFLKDQGVRFVYCNWAEFARLQDSPQYRVEGRPGYSEYIRHEVFNQLVNQGKAERIFNRGRAVISKRSGKQIAPFAYELYRLTD